MEVHTLNAVWEMFCTDLAVAGIVLQAEVKMRKCFNSTRSLTFNGYNGSA